MSETEQSNDDLKAAITDHAVLIQVTGRGSFKVAAPLKQFIIQVTSQRPLSTVAIDLEECVGMDSTFMGVLAGLAGRLKKNSQTLELINLSEKNVQLLQTLGVDQVLSFYRDDHGHQLAAHETTSVSAAPSSQKEMAETALRAHEKLVQINEANRPKFKRVIEFLKEDVDRLN